MLATIFLIFIISSCISTDFSDNFPETEPELLDQISYRTPKSTWTPSSTTEWPSTTLLFNRRSQKPILNIATENLTENLIVNTTKILLHVTTHKIESSTDAPSETYGKEPEQFCDSKKEQRLNQSLNHFKMMHDLWTFVIYFILIIWPRHR